MENLLKRGQQFLNTQTGKTVSIYKIDEDDWFTLRVVLENGSLSISSLFDIEVLSPLEIRKYISEGIYKPL